MSRVSHNPNLEGGWIMENLFLTHAESESKLPSYTFKKYEWAKNGLIRLHAESKSKPLPPAILRKKLLTLAELFSEVHVLCAGQSDSPQMPCSGVHECASIMHELATVDPGKPEDFQAGAWFYLDHCLVGLDLLPGEVKKQIFPPEDNWKRERISGLAERHARA